MGISIGNNTIGSLYLGSTKIGAAYLGNVKVYESGPALPAPGWVRMTFDAGVDPSTVVSWATWQQVSSSPNTWDTQQTYVYIPTYAFQRIYSVIVNASSWPGSNIIGLNSSSPVEEVTLYLTNGPVTSLSNLCYDNQNLQSLRIIGSGSVSNINGMCSGCTSLTSVPLFDTSSVTDCDTAFMGCTSVVSGALALYQQMSSQATPPSSHTDCFTDCGSNTVTGAAELAQIPSSWGGTGAYPESGGGGGSGNQYEDEFG